MKTRVAVFLLILFTQAVPAEENAINQYLAGHYLLVGKGIDTDRTYTGKVEISVDNGSLKLTRIVNGLIVVGSAAVEPALSGDAEVLRLRYMEAGKSYEQTCLWQGDLDNHARISCYLYEPGVNTRNPGLEVLFHDHTVD